jgi:tocopherol O-methyltransferase
MPANDLIRSYYDGNTRLFLRFGSSKEIQTIHRALWMDGVTSLSQALNAANDLILAQAQPGTRPLRIADLGCGVGATLLSLLARLPSNSIGIGLTLSSLQTRLGGEIFRARNLPGLVIEADFQHVPLGLGFDLAYAIESFVHAIEPELFFAEAARILCPALHGGMGGRLILIDDSRGAAWPQIKSEKRGRDWMDLYQRGWHIHSLFTPAELAALAAPHGLRLIENRLLNPFLRFRAIPDPAAILIMKLFSPFWEFHPIVPSMLGSMALQKCLSEGSVEYRWLVFERV